jgi:hypothetical protein
VANLRDHPGFVALTGSEKVPGPAKWVNLRVVEPQEP